MSSCEREGLPLLALGIGIDRGLGLVGLVGSRERMEYDFVGRTVNVAARVQTLTRIHQLERAVCFQRFERSEAVERLEPLEQIFGTLSPSTRIARRGLFYGAGDSALTSHK